MSFANPTPIRIGMTGAFDNRQYRVAGRVVMGMEDGGETYYWNEFNLVSDGGESATLVYEESERGTEWRLFTLFEPEFVMTAADVAAKRVGDQLNLDGRDVRVTLLDETRVYHIEGAAPEGVDLGDVAHYFNAETGNRMIVVSWTGEEVEYFRGVTVTPAMIASVFNLPSGALDRLSRRTSGSFPTANFMGTGTGLSSSAVVKLAGVVLGFAILVASYASCRSSGARATVSKTAAPAAPLILGGAGTLEGKNYRIQGHAIVEIAQVGRLYDRHEYHLADDDGNRYLLVYGLKPGEKDWFLFTPLTPLKPLTPARAAAFHAGETVNVDGFIASVAQLFQSVVRQAEGTELPDLKNGNLFFGFSAQSGSTPLLVRWNQDDLACYRGRFVARKDLEAAFGRKAVP